MHKLSTDTKVEFKEVLGIGADEDGTISDEENYNIAIWKEYCVVTNSRLDPDTRLYEIGEVARGFGLNGKQYEIAEDVIVKGRIKPRIASFMGDVLYLGGGNSVFDTFIFR